MRTLTKTHERPNQAPEDGTLALRWQRERDARALDVLVRRYLPLARKLARRYARSSIPIEDLQQVASLALVQAASRFDPSRERSFCSFAIPTILGELRRHFRDSGWSIHVPRGTQECAAAVREAKELLTHEHGCSPTVQALAQYLKIDSEQVLDALSALQAYEAGSLDAPVSDEGGAPALVDTLGTEDTTYQLVDRRADVRAALAPLDARSRQVLSMRFGEQLSQRQIGQRIGVSQMQVSRILRSVLDDLHYRVEADTATAY